MQHNHCWADSTEFKASSKKCGFVIVSVSRAKRSWTLLNIFIWIWLILQNAWIKSLLKEQESSHVILLLLRMENNNRKTLMRSIITFQICKASLRRAFSTHNKWMTMSAQWTLNIVISSAFTAAHSNLCRISSTKTPLDMCWLIFRQMMRKLLIMPNNC